jgi:hypothetical protein
VLKVIKILPEKLIIETEILVHSRMNSNSRYEEGRPVDAMHFICNRSDLVFTEFMTNVRTDKVLKMLARCISETRVLASALENP